MSFDELQNAWQSQPAAPRIVVNNEQLLKDVQRGQRALDWGLFRRDAIEIGVGFFLTVFFWYAGTRRGGIPFIACSLGCLFVSTFLLIDRIIQRRRRQSPDATLQAFIEGSLAQANHQIWLLKNIFWWYILPPGIGIVLVICSMAWELRDVGIYGLALVAAYALLCLLVCWGVYLLNQRAVKKSFEPRRQELESLLANLDESHQ